MNTQAKAAQNLHLQPLMRTVRALLEAHEAVTRIGGEQVRRRGLTPVEFDCLTQLGIMQPRRMCDLAECSCLTRSRTTQVVTELEKRGLVRRERNVQSDREVMATLTTEGQQLFDTIYPAYCEFMEEHFGERLDSDEQQQLIGLLGKLAHGPDCGC